MKKIIVVIGVALVGGFTLSNCSKDDGGTNGGPKVSTVAEKLMSNTWLEVGRISNGQDAFKTLANCEIANEYQFLADSVYRIHDGADTCDPRNPGPTDLEWWLKDNNTVLNIGRTDYDLIYINDSMFKISNNGVSGEFSHTYKRK